MERRDLRGTETGSVTPAPVAASAAMSRSWSEVVESLHDGLAMLDTTFTFVFASERFRTAAGLGTTSVVGRSAEEVFSGLGGDTAATLARVAEGRTVRVRHRSRTPEGDDHWAVVTIVPYPESDDRPAGAVMTCQDMTAINATMVARRDAQLRLTEVEEAEQRRISREIHDGPVQLLTALALRLDAAEPRHGADDRDPVAAMRRLLDGTVRELRQILVDFMPDRGTCADTLGRWMESFVVDGRCRILISDRGDLDPGPTVTRSFFVILSDFVRAAIAAGADDVEVEVAGGEHGHALHVRLAGQASIPLVAAAVPVRIRAIEEFARTMGADFSIEVDSAGIRGVSVLIALSEEQGDPMGPPASERPGGAARLDRSQETRASADLPLVLTTEQWEVIARATHEGLMEIDADLTVTSVNEAYARAMGRPVGEIVGLPLSALFTPRDYEHLLPSVRRVQAGESIRFSWQRRNARGEVRWVQVSAAARRDARGDFAGALLATLDTTDLHVIEQLHEDAVTELDAARRRTARRTVERLNGPLRALAGLSGSLAGVDETVLAPELRDALRSEIEASIARLRRSMNLISPPDLGATPLDAALRDSLGLLLHGDEVELTYDDATDLPVSGAQAEALFRIAREAVANAVVHGRAETVDLRLSGSEGGFELAIVDDGTGIDLRDRPAAAPHLGITSMKERAAEQGGRCRVEPGAAGGTQVVVWLPLGPDPAPDR